MMKHRDRVLAALNHEEADRPPFQATFTPEFADHLRAYFNLPPQFTEPHHRQWYGYELEKLTGQDIFQASAGWVTNYYLSDKPYTDDWGIKWKIDRYSTPHGEGFYTNMEKAPLADEAPDMDRYKAPDPNKPGMYDHVERLVREYKDEYYIIGRVHCTVFELAWALRGFENLLMDFYLDPGLANRILDITSEYHLEVAKNLARRGVDMIWLGDDFGAQTNLMISLETWKMFFKERYARICSAVKSINPDIKVAFHSDGCVYNIIPELIDAGVDVLNPIQTECMDPEVLKKRFGDNICFFGGIGVQSTLPMGTKDDIMKEYLWLKSTLGKGGGWICAPTHHVQLDTPVENFIDLVKASR
jgi:Uroporphyrinogen-III decarboxylase